MGCLLVSRCFPREEQLTKLAGRAGISVLAAGKFACLSAGLVFGESQARCGGTVLAALHVRCL